MLWCEFKVNAVQRNEPLSKGSIQRDLVAQGTIEIF